MRLHKKGKLLLVVGAFFVGLPLLAFVTLVVQGFVAQAGNETPLEVVATDIQKSQATITWSTEGNTQGVVEYGNTPTALNSYAPELEHKKDHAVQLTLLTPATTYYYQLRINGSVYDNEGVPWTFTTKTKDGREVAEVVKGISTRVSPTVSPTTTAQLSTNACTVTDCGEIQKKLGQGCSASDYFKCIANEGSPKPTSGYSSTAATPSPTPSPVQITALKCGLTYLQLTNENDCTKWTWDNFATKHPDCQSSFERYVFQCSSKQFTSTNSDDIPIWYYNNAIYNMTSNTATLESKPASGATVYCQVRAEDADGNATGWFQKSTTCTYTPTPTPK